MGRRGPKPTPTEALKERGTFREDRHGNRADTISSSGDPVRPRDLDPAGRALWDRIIKEHKGRGILGAIDTTELVMLCRTYSLWSSAMAVAKDMPLDKEARCAVVAYGNLVDKLLAKFGGSPADRANLKIDASSKPKEESKVAKLTRKRT